MNCMCLSTVWNVFCQNEKNVKDSLGLGLYSATVLLYISSLHYIVLNVCFAYNYILLIYVNIVFFLGPAEVPMMSPNGSIPPIHVPPGYISQVLNPLIISNFIVTSDIRHHAIHGFLLLKVPWCLQFEHSTVIFQLALILAL